MKGNDFPKAKRRVFVKVCSKKTLFVVQRKRKIFFESNPQGLTFTNAQSVAIFAFPFYFFLG